MDETDPKGTKRFLATLHARDSAFHMPNDSLQVPTREKKGGIWEEGSNGLSCFHDMKLPSQVHTHTLTILNLY